MPILIAEHVSKWFPVRSGRRALLGSGGLARVLRAGHGEGYRALDDISLSVEPGESLGIIGRNGSGKSTLLKILAGVTLPSTGEVHVRGRVASLLELGAGFHPMLTGLDNIVLNGQLLGLTRTEIARIFDDVVNFSGIGAFIDQPVDTYSSGMYIRIAFSVAVHANPDIFLVDEVLSVGDEEFQRQCRRRIGELREAGKTILFVSHDLGLVHALCDRVLLLENGKALSRGTSEETITYYLRRIGRAGGIHSIRQNGVEALFVHGRVALYVNGVELTAPQGIQGVVQSLGAFHASTQAEWEMVEHGETYCRARGRLPRLPMLFEIQMSLDDTLLKIAVDIVVERPLKIDYYGIQTQLPAAYDTWIAGTKRSPLPAHRPGDVEWTHVSFGDPVNESGVALPEESSGMTPLRFSSDTAGQSSVWNVHNTDFMAGARVIALEAYRPGSEELPAGRTHMLSMTMDLGQSRISVLDAYNREMEKATLTLDRFRVHFDAGSIQLAHDGTTLSAHLHAHTQQKLGGMWQLSNQLRWDTPQRTGECVRVVGYSSRAPLCEIWELEREEAAIRWRVWVEAKAPVQLDEMNMSIALNKKYTEWRTINESGAFPAAAPQQRDWAHCNRRYDSGIICAAGEGMPEITLQSSGGMPCHMSAVVTPPEVGVHVLQAILSPERDACFRFPQGRHLMFDGILQARES